MPPCPDNEPMIPGNPLKPICDSHNPLYIVPMKHVGVVRITGPGLEMDLHDTYQCADDFCRRFFDHSVGYYSVPSNEREPRPTLSCFCTPEHHRWMPLVSASNDRGAVRLGCLKCGKISEPMPWPT
jgi:hypothetical protein